MGCRVEDLYVPVPHLSQRALFKAMRGCRFGLAYNEVPESFGFYVLESVHNGCPVFTNGVGNNRYLLPAGHGITVLEDAQMAMGSPEAFVSVAEAIHSSLSDPEVSAVDCGRGAALIDATFTRAALERDLAALLGSLEQTREPAAHFEELELGLGPLVRFFDAPSGVVACDLASVSLAPERAGQLNDLLGSRCRDVTSKKRELLEAANWFFDRGLLSLTPVSQTQGKRD